MGPSAAVAYAFTYYANYNPNWCDYHTCGNGDCTNFVSQCFAQGGELPDATWYNYFGVCGNCSGISRWAGSNAFVNNVLLRNWVIDSGRGKAQSSASVLGLGDIINYDWAPYDGVYDHVVLVTTAAGPLITAHSGNVKNVPYNSLGAAHYQFTTVYTSYNA